MIIVPFIKLLNKWLFCVWWVGVLGVIVAGVCLFSGKTEKPISDMFAVCGAGGRSQCWKCGWCVLFSLHANYAGITTCGLFAQCWNCIQFVCRECKLADFRRTRARAGDLASCARTRDVHWTHWRTSIYFYADADVLLINLSSSTYSPTCKDRPWLHYRPGGGVNKIGWSNSPEITQYNNGTLALLQDGMCPTEELCNILR